MVIIFWLTAIVVIFVLITVALAIKIKLTGWYALVDLFPASGEPAEEAYIGMFSEYISSKTRYPLVDQFTKYIPCRSGLYVKIDMKLEKPQQYDPILVPWKNLFIILSSEWSKDGFDRYQIYDDEGTYLGQLKIQSIVSEKIINYIERTNIKINIK